MSLQQAPVNSFKIDLRGDQTLDDLRNFKYQDENVKIFAPDWVLLALDKITSMLPITTRIEVRDANGNHVDYDFGTNGLTLKTLLAIARSDKFNVTGLVDFDNYSMLSNDYKVTLAIKDLARQCIVAGPDKTTHYGGYRTKRTPSRANVIVVDLAGLQFQQVYNSGRLVLVTDQSPPGLVDDIIFTNIVGQPKPSLEQCRQDTSGRFVQIGSAFFDTLAYRRFVATDFLMAGLTVNQIAQAEVNFKFLKYGTGNFAGYFAPSLNQFIYDGVSDGIKLLGELLSKQPVCWIKSIELPFFDRNEKIRHVCKQFGFECQFTEADALFPGDNKRLMATTICGDPHSPMGNEMNHRSVNASVAENLRSRGNKFSPVINKAMGEEFVNVPYNKIGEIVKRSQSAYGELNDQLEQMMVETI